MADANFTEQLRHLSPPKKGEGWSNRNKSTTVLNSVREIDADLKKLLKAAWESS